MDYSQGNSENKFRIGGRECTSWEVMLSISMETSLVTALLITLMNCIVPGWKPGQLNGEFQTDWLCLVPMRDAQGTAPQGNQLWFALGAFSLMAKTA